MSCAKINSGSAVGVSVTLVQIFFLREGFKAPVKYKGMHAYPRRSSARAACPLQSLKGNQPKGGTQQGT